MHDRSMHKRRAGFSLIELLVVIAVITILIGLLMPAVQAAREAANRTECANNLKQLGLAMHLYHDMNQRLPPSRQARREGPSWAWLILPELEQTNLYQQWEPGSMYPGIPPGVPITKAAIAQAKKVLSTPVPTYFCPSRRAPTGGVLALSFKQTRHGCALETSISGSLGDYAAAIGTTGFDHALQVPNSPPVPPNGPFEAVTGLRFADIPDGLTNTIMLGEKHVPRGQQGAYPWDTTLFDGEFPVGNTRPAGPGFPLAVLPDDPRWIFGGPHPGICQFVLCDGSVRPIVNSIDPTILGLLAQRNDGQVIPDY